MEGLKIKTTDGEQFEINGKVTFKDFPECGRIFYCGGQSWPEEIVTGIMTADDMENTAMAYRDIQAKIKELEAEAELLKTFITTVMDAKQVDTMQAGIFTIRYTLYESSRLDITALKNELPDVAARYAKTTETRRFQVA